MKIIYMIQEQEAYNNTVSRCWLQVVAYFNAYKSLVISGGGELGATPWPPPKVLEKKNSREILSPNPKDIDRPLKKCP